MALSSRAGSLVQLSGRNSRRPIITSTSCRTSVKDMRHLQLGLLASDNRPVFTPVEPEGFARCKDQWHERAASAGLLFTLPINLLCPHRGSNTAITSIKAKCHKIGMHLLGCAPFNLPDRNPIAKVPPPVYNQSCHIDHSMLPPNPQVEVVQTWALLSGNLCPSRVNSQR